MLFSSFRGAMPCNITSSNIMSSSALSTTPKKQHITIKSSNALLLSASVLCLSLAFSSVLSSNNLASAPTTEVTETTDSADIMAASTATVRIGNADIPVASFARTMMTFGLVESDDPKAPTPESRKGLLKSIKKDPSKFDLMFQHDDFVRTVLDATKPVTGAEAPSEGLKGKAEEDVQEASESATESRTQPHTQLSVDILREIFFVSSDTTLSNWFAKILGLDDQEHREYALNPLCEVIGSRTDTLLSEAFRESIIKTLKDDELREQFSKDLYSKFFTTENEDIHSSWRTRATALTAEGKLPLMLLTMQALGNGSNAAALINARAIADLTDDTRPQIRYYPAGYNPTLQTFFSQHEGQEFFILQEIGALKAQLEAETNEDKKIELKSQLALLGIRLHVAANPEDIYFDAMPPALQIPIISSETTQADLDLIIALLRTTIGQEVRILKEFLTGDIPQTEKEVRLYNYVFLTISMRTTAINILQRLKTKPTPALMDAYMTVLNYHVAGLSNRSATWGDFRNYYDGFFKLPLPRGTIAVKGTFYEHDDIKDADPLVYAQKDRLADAKRNAKKAMNSFADATAQYAASLDGTLGDDPQSRILADDAGLTHQIYYVLQGAQEAADAGNMVLFGKLMRTYEALRKQLIGISESSSTGEASASAAAASPKTASIAALPKLDEIVDVHAVAADGAAPSAALQANRDQAKDRVSKAEMIKRRAAELDAEQDALIAKLTEGGPLGEDEKQAIVARATEIAAELEELQQGILREQPEKSAPERDQNEPMVIANLGEYELADLAAREAQLTKDLESTAAAYAAATTAEKPKILASVKSHTTELNAIRAELGSRDSMPQPESTKPETAKPDLAKPEPVEDPKGKNVDPENPDGDSTELATAPVTDSVFDPEIPLSLASLESYTTAQLDKRKAQVSEDLQEISIAFATADEAEKGRILAETKEATTELNAIRKELARRSKAPETSTAAAPKSSQETERVAEVASEGVDSDTGAGGAPTSEDYLALAAQLQAMLDQSGVTASTASASGSSSNLGDI